MTTRDKDNNSRTIIIILSVLLALLTIFTIYNMKTSNDKVDALTTQKKSLKKDLDEKIAALESAMTDNLQMNDELTEAKSKLISLRDSIDYIKDMDRQTINSINRRLAQLEKENVVLIKEAETLRAKNRKLTIENDSAKADIERKANQIEEQEVANTELNEKNTELEEKVKLGSALSISSVSTTTMRQKRSGVLKETTAARKVDAFRTNFTIRENVIAEKGVKKIYLAIVDAKGNVIASKGKITDIDGNTIPYTDETEVEYNNTDIQVVMVSSLPENSLIEGRYEVKIYLENKYMASQVVTLK